MYKIWAKSLNVSPTYGFGKWGRFVLTHPVEFIPNELFEMAWCSCSKVPIGRVLAPGAFQCTTPILCFIESVDTLLTSCNFCKFQNDFDDDGQLDSIAPTAPSTARRRRNHLEVQQKLHDNGDEGVHTLDGTEYRRARGCMGRLLCRWIWRYRCCEWRTFSTKRARATRNKRTSSTRGSAPVRSPTVVWNTPRSASKSPANSARPASTRSCRAACTCRSTSNWWAPRIPLIYCSNQVTLVAGAHVCLTRFRLGWGSIEVHCGPHVRGLVPPASRAEGAPKAREAGGTSPRAWGPQWTLWTPNPTWIQSSIHGPWLVHLCNPHLGNLHSYAWSWSVVIVIKWSTIKGSSWSQTIVWLMVKRPTPFLLSLITVSVLNHGVFRLIVDGKLLTELKEISALVSPITATVRIVCACYLCCWQLAVCLQLISIRHDSNKCYFKSH